MSKLDNTTTLEIYRMLKQMRVNIDVAKSFTGQIEQVDRLLNNDKTGLVSTIIDFMIHSATVDIKIETGNDSLNNALQKWQKNILNQNVNIDIPGGLRALSTENYRERWRSSLLALKVIWGEEKFGNQTFILPKKMWFLDGGAIETKSNGALNTRQFFLKRKGKDPVELKNGLKESVFIRKPYTSWHKNKVTPYLVRRGTLFNSLIKDAIVKKQSDVIEAIIPIILKLQAGNDQLALEGLAPKKEAFEKLKEQLVQAKERFEESGDIGDIIASLRHDVSLEYLIPDLAKIFDEKVVKSTDRNLLASLGLIELQGFSNTRQEAILNPKVLVEEVVDAVGDWTNLLQDVMIEMLKRNKPRHSNLANNEIQVIPGTIKAFMTDEMRTMLRSLYDRGILSKQNASEDIGNLNFEVQVNRRERETERGLNNTMKPPVIQNLEQHIDPELQDENENQDKKPGTPEADNFNNAILKQWFATHSRKHLKKRKKKKKDEDYSQYIIQTPEELPSDIKELSLPAQLTYFMTYNLSIEDGIDPKEADSIARNEIDSVITSNDKKEKVKAEEENKEILVTCQNCDNTFDYTKVPEVSMGCVKCPSCKSKVNQEGVVAKEIIQAPYNNIDELPENVRNVLPVPAQLIWMKVFNSVFEETGDEERAIRSAWSKVKEQYEKVPDKKKWVKKARLEDYKDEMSPYAYRLFEEMYNTAIEHSDTNESAIKTALAIVARICTKNKDNIWVKDKTVTKDTLQKLDNPGFFAKIMELEIQEKKNKLLDKLLKDEDE